MALFSNTNYSGNIGKTHTNLLVSEGNAPAEQFLVSKTNTAKPFYYEFGPEGNQLVTLAKGKLVEAVGEEVNRRTGYTETAIRVAQEDSVRAIGVNHHNISEETRSARGGDYNRPTVLTRSYIELPLFEHETIATAADSASAMNFGAVYGGTTTKLKSGDFVVAGKDGNFKAFTDETDPRAIVGQVLNVNRNLPPAGLLQYYTGLDNAQDVQSYLASLLPTGTESPMGAPYSVGAWKKDFLTSLGLAQNTGIPFLTDGYFSALQTLTTKIDDEANVEAATGSKSVTVDGANVTVDDTETDGAVYIKLKHKLDARNLDSVVVKYTVGEEQKTVNGRDVHVDVNNNTIIVYLDANTTATAFEVTADMVVNPTAGIPTEWDYKGSVGAARILLLR